MCIDMNLIPVEYDQITLKAFIERNYSVGMASDILSGGAVFESLSVEPRTIKSGKFKRNTQLL
jgi:hypothetical protein